MSPLDGWDVASRRVDQRDGRLAGLVRDGVLSGVAFLSEVVFVAVAAFLRAAFFVGPALFTALLAASTVSVPGAGATVVSSPDGQRTRRSEPVTTVTTPSRSGPFIDDSRIRSPTLTIS